MKTAEIKTGRALGFLVAGLLATAGVMAEKPEWAGGGRHGKPEQNDIQNLQSQRSPNKADGRSNPVREGRHGPSPRGGKPVVRVGGHFDDAQRTAVRNYYSEQYRSGRCPPGLAKKNNGCMPPGQAKKWVMGQRLPREVVYYSLPPTLIVQLSAPPAGHRYVRVGSDILLITISNRLVIDVMLEFGRI